MTYPTIRGFRDKKKIVQGTEKEWSGKKWRTKRKKSLGV